MNPEPYDPIEPENERQLAWQPFCTVTLMLPDTVIKWGHKIRPLEEASMRLVEKHAPSIPIPQLKHAIYKYDASDGEAFYGELFMSYVPGKTLKAAWAGFDDATKGRICQDIWDMVATIRTIPRPAHLAGDNNQNAHLYCTADGSPSRNPLLGDNNDVTPAFLDEQTFRDRIYARYVAHNGLSYRDSAEYLPDRLPRSDTDTGPVFTHGDIAPRNIIVDDDGRILALLDWESSGWFPDWWEYAQMMGICDELEYDWQHWMERTRPVPWDISAIQKARRVLF
ncbi:Phosphotransferase family protein [Niveomyces insectorum RCEF 264]|uniref:Phosphotransferase family protein n=1 Tax=Niveomyces insectorum RCEF 264 TaxID=1081102 RepID=A0A167Z123_9HYPO|nr:Phosphotransferase family protein [Niveomyces insectorum RCEF 264]